MNALQKQTQTDLAAPFRPQVKHGMIQLRPKGWKRIEYGMGHAWLVLRLRKFQIWLRIEKR